MKILAAALVVVLTLLQYRLWLGEGGMREVRRLRGEIQAQHGENQQLKERNRTLSAEVIDLKKGTVAIEERARTDLGMVGKGETFYQVVAPSASVAPEPATPHAIEPDDERRVVEARAPTKPTIQRQ
jgi:cell division protein FtsB